jgi:nicotinamidase-related amidase
MAGICGVFPSDYYSQSMVNSMTRPWSGIVSEEEIRRYEAAGFGRPTGIGTRPALLIIDVQYRTVGTQRVPFWSAIEEFKTSCGDAGWDAVDHIAPLLRLFRERKFPVLYPYVAPKLGYDSGRLAQKVPDIMNIPSRGYDFVEQIAPVEGDILVPKKHPSAFFGTPLVSYLIDKQIDTLIVTGCSTSGCVRGTVVDGFAYNFRVIVPEECVYDRSPIAHAVNLFDMAYKYADVQPLASVMRELSGIKS